MICPEDGAALHEAAPGVWACALCRGQAVRCEELARTRPLVSRLLRPEDDGESGGFARPRRCPRCGWTMAPRRIGDQLAWLERCEPCGLLWVEKLDHAVMDRLAARAAVEGAVAALPPAERRELAQGLAAEVGEELRGLRRLRRLVSWLGELTDPLWWPWRW